MPTILLENGFRFFFYSNEGNEPPHIHVEKGDGVGKYWLSPIKEEYLKGFKKKESKKIDKIITNNQSLFLNKWYEYFG